ncbi:hypothetical protein AB0F25_30400 [Streptomyces wedmorensis]|uniref:hypothetical protein n=1 Tax=Streptomyces wedmorensis TaxID=43759 RepID=UPI0034434253
MGLEFNGPDNQYVTIGGANGRVVQFEDVAQGSVIGAYCHATKLAVIGTVKHVFTRLYEDSKPPISGIQFEDDERFRVIYNGWAFMVDPELYTFAWREGMEVTFNSPVLTKTNRQIWDDTVTPGKSIAVVDMTDVVWQFGTPFPEHEGRLSYWCMECGTRLHGRLTGTITAGTQVGLFDECQVTKNPHHSVPVKIWTPRSWYFVNIPVNIRWAMREAEMSGVLLPDLFDPDAIKHMKQHAVTDSDVWFDAAFDCEDPPPGYKPDF